MQKKSMNLSIINGAGVTGASNCSKARPGI